jgi:phosphoesterase RecJ-like protein
MTRAPEPRLDDAQRSALELLRDSERFLLTGHERPDGDCLGAQAALYSMLTGLGREVRVINPDPPDARYDYLAEFCPYETHESGELPPHDVAVFLDINEITRCGAVGRSLASMDSKRLVIDHHVFHGERWWNESFTDERAASTGTLVWRIGRALGIPLDRQQALGIFTSMVTDTGWFRYSNSDAETFSIAAELVGFGIEPVTIFDSIFQREAPGLPRALGSLLERVEYLADGRLAVVTLPLAEAAQGVAHASDPMLDVVRSVDAVEVVLYLREAEGGVCKLSSRSKTDYDVAALARVFGGGGHRKAAGATIPGALDDVRARLVGEALERFASKAPPRAETTR